MAGRRVLFTVKAGVEAAIRHQGETIIRLTPTEPGLESGSDVNEDELVLGAAAMGTLASIVVPSTGERLLVMVLSSSAVDIIHIETAGGGDRVYVDLRVAWLTLTLLGIDARLNWM